MTDCMHIDVPRARSPARRSPSVRVPAACRACRSPSRSRCTSAPRCAVEPFVLKDIRVEGLQRSDAGTVFAALPFRIGDTYTDEKGAAALRALFATGLFKDVRIDIENGVAVVIVDERAVIASIDFVGLKEFEKDALVKSLKDFGIGEGLPFDQALADRAEQELKRQYLTRSLYGAEVVTTVTPQERNRVNVTFTITEGDPAKIREIRIAGNRAFSEGTLKGAVRAQRRRLAQLLPEGRPLFARQAQRRPRDAARVLPEPRLPRDGGRVDAGDDLARQAGHRDHHQRQGRPALHGHRRQAGRRLPRQGRRLPHPGGDQAGRSVPRRGRRGDDARVRRPLRHLRLRVRQGRRAARDRPRQRPGGRHPRRRAAAPRLRAAHQHRRQHAHARRGDPARVPPVRVVLVRRAQDQALARPGRPARLLQRSQRRHRRGARHRPTRST